MIDPDELIVEYGEALLAGDFDRILRRYAIPLVVALPRTQVVLSSASQIMASVKTFRNELISRGVTQYRSSILGHGMISDDLAYYSARTDYLSAEGQIMTDSRTSYVLHRMPDGWKIQLLSLDKPADSDAERDLRRAQRADERPSDAGGVQCA